MQRALLVLFSIIVLICLIGMATGSRIVSAQSTQVQTSAQTTQSSRQQVTCSGEGCDGLDPQPAGCAADAYTVQTAVFSDSYVELRYSPTCGTNWGG
jgi:hypothetical protein